MIVDPLARPMHIILVDDNPNNLKVLSEAIQGCGWEILIAIDGETAIEQIEYAHPDLILLDVKMPGIDGFETCRRLKANPTTQNIPVIFMTGLSDTTDKVKGLEIGAVDYITKPVQQEEVIARLKLHLKISQLTQTLEERVKERTAELAKSLEELRISEARFQKLSDNIPGVIYQLCFNPHDRTLNIPYISSGCYDLYEVSAQAMISGQFSLRDFEHPDDRARIDQIIQQSAKQLTPFQQEWRIITPNGQIKWIQTVAQPERQADGLILWDGIVIDISERARLQARRNQAEAALAESEAKFRRLVEGANDMIWSAQTDGTITYLSPQFQTMFGFLPSDWVGRSFIDLIHPDDIEKMMISASVVAKQGKKQQNIEFRHLCHQTDLYLWVTVNVTPIKDAAGNLIGMQGIVRDISDRKATEEQLKQQAHQLAQANQQLENYSQTLEQRVQERTAELQAAQERMIAQEKLASLGTLTAGIAHELCNPLNFVKNYAEGSIELTQDLLDCLQPIMLSQLAQTTAPIASLITDLQTNATSIRRHSQRAEQIIASMMQHARSDGEQLVPKLIQLHALLNEAVQLAYRSKRARGDGHFALTIHTDYASDVDWISVIPTALIRALINLIDNACDAMWFKQQGLTTDSPPGTTPYTPTLAISTQRVGEQVEIRIRDNGCGIDPQIQTRIFDPFFTTKPPGAGTGLGLFLTHDIIVKQHQGTLVIDAVLGEFTEAIITLPYRQNT